ncbi:MAG: cytidine deaminase [Bacteroidales bacterium]|jgi:cytidine deaminase|nr:cytidine deaminase [Bacteroidales bacterium]
MKKQKIIHYQEFDSLNALPPDDKELMLMARQAATGSYSPFSRFKVGSAVRLDDNTVVFGSNQENVSYPNGLCAERVALFAAGSDVKGRRVKAIAVSAEKDGHLAAAMPCGACLQTMLETEKRSNQPITVLIALGEERCMKVEGVKNLMPFAFNEF